MNIFNPFSPYADNGGNVVAIAGADYAVIASDTRLLANVHKEYGILSRSHSKLFLLSDKAVIGCCGCWCDTLTLTRVIRARMEMYYHDTSFKVMPTPSVALMLSNVLYYKRFFPFAVMSVLAGLDHEGKGCVWSYDVVGHCEKTWFKARGTAGPMIQSILDSKLGRLNRTNESGDAPFVSQDEANEIVKNAFFGAIERDVCTGDELRIVNIKKEGIKEETMHLRRD